MQLQCMSMYDSPCNKRNKLCALDNTPFNEATCCVNHHTHALNLLSRATCSCPVLAVRHQGYVEFPLHFDATIALYLLHRKTLSLTHYEMLYVDSLSEECVVLGVRLVSLGHCTLVEMMILPF